MIEKLRFFYNWLLGRIRRGSVPTAPLVILLAGVIGVLGGYGAVLFSSLISLITDFSLVGLVDRSVHNQAWLVLLCFVPAVGLLLVSWFTRLFAPEAQGHGVPEVISAIARHDGVIRPRVALVKILASGLCIGTGGSVGREGPIVQIGAALGSVAGQIFKLSAQNVKVLVAAGAAAGISATFHAPLAGVIFASEIILGSFAVESLTPIVIASVLADVVQTQYGEHGLDVAFPRILYQFEGAWEQLPSYLVLGLLCGLGAVGFTKLLYFTEDLSEKWLPRWQLRAIVLGLIVGVVAVVFHSPPPILLLDATSEIEAEHAKLPPLLGVGYGAVTHLLHLENKDKHSFNQAEEDQAEGNEPTENRSVQLDRRQMIAELWWILPLVLLKPLLTSLTLAGGGSGGIFAPSLFLGATLGGAFGLLCNIFLPDMSANPGVYAVVGMGAVVAGTTHGVLSAILIVYEMTGDYRIILPIMFAAGLASVVAGFIDEESIYHKKLSRRGELTARGQDLRSLEHVMVRDVMIRTFPTLKHTDNVTEIIKVARANTHLESFPVMNEEGLLVGIIRPEDLHRIIDTDISPHLLNAEDIALSSLIAVSPNANLLEALRDFGLRDVETLPVESVSGNKRRLVGLLLRSDVMRRYRQELLKHRTP